METDTDKFFDIQRQQYQSEIATEYLIETTPNEQIVDEYRESSNGNYLKWPESIHKNKNKIIIHGHRPITVDVCKEIVLSNKNVINLDTGCVYSNMNGYGTLTAIELNTRSLYFA